MTTSVHDQVYTTNSSNFIENENDEATLFEEQEFNFASSCTDNFPKILAALNISLAVTSYQAHRLFFLRSDGEKIETHFKAFPRPMGVYADNERLTIGTFSQVLEFRRSDGLLEKIKHGVLDNTDKMTHKILEKDKEKMEAFVQKRSEELKRVKESDALYLSRAAITTGMINIHDIAWGDGGLWVVNSTFSCLSTLSPDYSFVARWKPPFISELVPEDRCHLNGMAMFNGRPRFVTTFNQLDKIDSWNQKSKASGTLIDVDTDEILLDKLVMPHSPRIYNNKVYLCDSGVGKLLCYDLETRTVNEIMHFQGFPRGMNFYGPLLFVGLSKVRDSDEKEPIPLARMYEETYSGIRVINLEDNSEIASLTFEGDLEQIYDIAIIPHAVNPEILNIDDSLIRHAYEYDQKII